MPFLRLSPTPAIPSDRKKTLLEFQSTAGVRFKKLELLNQAFAHRSYANERSESTENNEKLEFLGDSVLGLVVAEHLYKILGDRAEGDLARIKSCVVSEDSLAGSARNHRGATYILIGKGV